MPSDGALKKYAPLVLRIGLSLLFLWFGFSQITKPVDWIAWVPLWVPTFLHMPVQVVVLLNGGFEVIFGILLLLGLYVRWVALLLGLHIWVIAYEVGYNDIGVRDFCLGVCCIAQALFGDDTWTIRKMFSHNEPTGYSTLS